MLLAALVTNLREAKRLRDVLCHGSWQLPDAGGQSLPFFVDKKLNEFITPVDVEFLEKTRRGVAELICDAMDTVTSIGIQFPGTNGPGKRVW